MASWAQGLRFGRVGWGLTLGIPLLFLALGWWQGPVLPMLLWLLLVPPAAAVLLALAWLLRRLRPALTALFTLLLVLAALSLTEQGRDLARLSAIGGASFGLVGALLFWQLGSWWEGRAGWRRVGGRRSATALWTPRLLALAVGAVGPAVYAYGGWLLTAPAIQAGGLMGLALYLLGAALLAAWALRWPVVGPAPLGLRLAFACLLCLGLGGLLVTTFLLAEVVLVVPPPVAAFTAPLATGLPALALWALLLLRRPMAQQLAAWARRLEAAQGTGSSGAGPALLERAQTRACGLLRFGAWWLYRLPRLLSRAALPLGLLVLALAALTPEILVSQGSLAAAMLAAGTWLALLGRVQQWPGAIPRGLAALALASLVLTGWLFPYHPIRLCGQGADCGSAGESPPPRPRPEEALARWRTQAADPARPLVLVASAGGGIRASAFTLDVLRRLDAATDGRFACDLFAISAVSGGAVGAGLWLLERYGDGCRSRAPTGFDAEAVLAADLLAAPLTGLLLRDLPRALIPLGPPHGDRAALFERTLESLSGGRLARPFTSLFPWLGEPDAPFRPALLLNTTLQQTGERVVVSPLRLDGVGAMVDFLTVTDRDLPASSALHLSARFAYVSPAGRWRDAAGRWRGHLIDGGYAENFGALSLGELLDALAPALAGRKLLVVQISSDPTITAEQLLRLDSAQGCHAAPPARPPSAVLAELRAPLAGLLVSREARGREAVRALCEATRRQGGLFLHFGLCREVGPVPLGWALAPGSRARIQSALGRCGNERELMRLTRWLGSSGPLPSPAPAR